MCALIALTRGKSGGGDDRHLCLIIHHPSNARVDIRHSIADEGSAYCSFCLSARMGTDVKTTIEIPRKPNALRLTRQHRGITRCHKGISAHVCGACYDSINGKQWTSPEMPRTVDNRVVQSLTDHGILLITYPLHTFIFSRSATHCCVIVLHHRRTLCCATTS